MTPGYIIGSVLGAVVGASVVHLGNPKLRESIENPFIGGVIGAVAGFALGSIVNTQKKPTDREKTVKLLKQLDLQYRNPQFVSRGGDGAIWKIEKGGIPYALKLLHDPKRMEHGDYLALRCRDIHSIVAPIHLIAKENSSDKIFSIEAFSPELSESLILGSVYPWKNCIVFGGSNIHDMQQLYACLASQTKEDRIDYLLNKLPSMCLNIVDAIEKLHAKNIVHRDIKPENILLSGPFSRSSSPQAYLGDFGFAVHVGSNTLISEKLGTMEYMAPEVLRLLPEKEEMNPYNGKKADIYSLGMTFLVLHFHGLNQIKRCKDIEEYIRLRNQQVQEKLTEMPCYFQNGSNPYMQFVANLCKLCMHEDPVCRPDADLVSYLYNHHNEAVIDPVMTYIQAYQTKYQRVPTLQEVRQFIAQNPSSDASIATEAGK